MVFVILPFALFTRTDSSSEIYIGETSEWSQIILLKCSVQRQFLSPSLALRGSLRAKMGFDYGMDAGMNDQDVMVVNK